MAKKIFSLAALDELDLGKIDRAFKHELGRVVRDLVARPGDDRPRAIKIAFTFKPEGDSGVCERCMVEVEMDSRLPSVRSKVYEMEVGAGGALAFNPLSPDDVKQRTLDESGA